MGAFLTEIFWLHYSKVSENTKTIAGNALHGAISILLFIVLIYKDRNKANVLFNERIL